ncbi:hypothetical protein [Parasitella parasitica]|uniref:Galactose oxidase n=1 Tax=Parasitella parasitica TaxID=35722 RepID=A0A0B7NTZ1_9FUNG|nr:hypothetical protein [Parasitella parasitica]
MIVAQQASDPRSYASTIIQSKYIFVIGGSTTSLSVPILNFTDGIDIKNPQWLERARSSSDILKPFEKGVAFQGAGKVFVQGGIGTSTEMQNLMEYTPATDGWSSPYQEHVDRPNPSYMMTATVNPSTNISYYYGGTPIDYVGSSFSAVFTSFDTKTGAWKKLSPKYPNAVRPGRVSHSSNIINNQLFIMGGVTDDANATTQGVQADFESVLVYDINNDTAVAVATLGDIPPLKQSFSTALGLDGHSIVLFGGYTTTSKKAFEAANNDIYILDTCTLTWRKQSVSGISPGPIYAHNAININNYMVVLMGKVDETNYNEKVFILDMKNWKWVNNFDSSSTSDSISESTCSFDLPSTDSNNFYQFNYDYSVIDNPLRPKKSPSKTKGFAIGFSILALLLLAAGTFFFTRHRRNNKFRTLNPRWMRNVSSQSNNGCGPYGDDRDYPLFVYNKELDNDNPNNPNIKRQNVFAPHGIRTYTASDHEQWEEQLSQESENPRDNQMAATRHSEIWKRMRGLNEDEHSGAPNHSKLLDV